MFLVDGILIIDKPEGFTSHDVVARVRRIFKTKRVGHTGTLDPFATGVLVLLLGKATRLAQFLDKDTKEYIATILFGFETDTGDKTGMRSAECGLRNEKIAEILQTVDWDLILSQFRGEIEQTPPMHSAKKVDGKKLYELARKGIEIERKPVQVAIYELALLHEAIRNPQSAIRIRVACSAGTYIRTLAEDIGRRLGIGAHLEELRRTRAGKFDISQSITIESLENLQDRVAPLFPMIEAVSHLPRFVLNADRVEKTRSGLSTRFDGTLEDAAAIQMVDDEGTLIAVGFYSESEKTVRPKVVLI